MSVHDGWLAFCPLLLEALCVAYRELATAALMLVLAKAQASCLASIAWRHDDRAVTTSARWMPTSWPSEEPAERYARSSVRSSTHLAVTRCHARVRHTRTRTRTRVQAI